ncbi:hypothetical protein PHYBLDRAFT_65038 [Phycomyces blakesleeanus NRRL 1555(-)]|uniref:Uncharacterized protein n=1 Tax=Phycomyces blakesleeanus (strain ATCC 8743b / DSM 1359 / FGSC 10004 / NBRC 33097 / NRRL 1555) TaxID=763407 RepID=A0A162U7L2_PHYB8|nr:hypothetical protein PHYBLDRAFT_65038 [Phycomyces blakesleeanus NRRL 1555(-)]OAD73033.1 hypothetical protein PHYBLDRAFT_65038 [Phycomyces blakesleeanus NRRL 1555(-)]|eukprot:XP_018291073.1 hypothetical protein PHYBLDRAFT_65038 [Phycomyces blakesleeanus NRRL 1555(-)]
MNRDKRQTGSDSYSCFQPSSLAFAITRSTITIRTIKVGKNCINGQHKLYILSNQSRLLSRTIDNAQCMFDQQQTNIHGDIGRGIESYTKQQGLVQQTLICYGR